MMLGQETGALASEPFVCLMMLDTPLIPSAFIARRRTGWLSYHLLQVMSLENWKSLSPIGVLVFSSFNFGTCF